MQAFSGKRFKKLLAIANSVVRGFHCKLTVRMIFQVSQLFSYNMTVKKNFIILLLKALQFALLESRCWLKLTN